MSELSTAHVHVAERPARAKGTLVDAVVILGWFLVLGLLCAVVWNAVTPLAQYTVTKDGAVMEQPELAKQVATDGWYAVIAAVAALVSGIVLATWRGRDPVVTVVLIALGGALAAYAMLRLGLLLGPPEPNAATKAAEVGSTVPLQLKPAAPRSPYFEIAGYRAMWPPVVFVWPIAALFGAVGMLWGTAGPRRDVSPVTDESTPLG